MRVVEKASELTASFGGAFVPTMGALHEGHAALIRRARVSRQPALLSIFVNPTQFGPNEDYTRYPRTLDADLAIARAEGVDVVFIPGVDDIYPEGVAAANEAAARLPLPDVATKPHLEDRARPGHFAGVQLVVARLFDLVRPAVAVFGEKDWQQLKLVESMVRIAHAATPGRWPGLRIEAHPTVREPDGLALSSRNRYMPTDTRAHALGIARALKLAAGAPRPTDAERVMRGELETHGFAVDYAVVRDAETLMPPSRTSALRALIAARLSWNGGGVRLIDNRPVSFSQS